MIDFDCLQFQRWLDEGGAAGAAGSSPCAADDAAAHLHAATCAPCGELLAAEQAVARVLVAAPAPSPPAGFADRVLARVAVTPQARPARLAAAAAAPAFVTDALPWWVRAAAQPASALALGLAGVAVLFAPRLLATAQVAPAWSAQAVAAAASALAPWVAPVAARAAAGPVPGPALAFALLPLVPVASLAAYRLGLRLASPAPVLAPAARA